jgi:hypothetical protein
MPLDRNAGVIGQWNELVINHLRKLIGQWDLSDRLDFDDGLVPTVNFARGIVYENCDKWAGFWPTLFWSLRTSVHVLKFLLTIFLRESDRPSGRPRFQI